MSAPLAPCPTCHRHVQITESSCPFCAASLDGLAPPTFDARAAPRRVAHVALAVGASLALGACPSPVANVYGGPPPPQPTPRTSADASLNPTPAPTPPTPAPQQPPSDDGSRGEVYGAPPPPPAARK